jgi:hypothetical protein
MKQRPSSLVPWARGALAGRHRGSVTTRVSSTNRSLYIALWATGGVALTFVEAVLRLGSRAHQTIRSGLTASEWVALCVWVLTLCYFEGYRALQKKFAPGVVARALTAGRELSGCWSVIGAPAYALGLYGAPRAAVLRSWLGVAAIVAAVLVVRALPPVWRGIVDAGVATALLWGLLALLSSFARALSQTVRAARLLRNQQAGSAEATRSRA